MKKTAVALLFTALAGRLAAAPLGLPPVPIPADNPQTPAKIALGDRLFHDTRFSADGKVSCATCHAQEKAFTDNLPVSKGFSGLTGTRNAPTVINSAYMKTLFWDGREPDLEGQSKQPFINPVEGGLPDHKPLLAVIRKDRAYTRAFKKVFGADRDAIDMGHVAMAIASFERTVVSGDSPFDRYYYGRDSKAMTPAQVRGLAVFTGKGRCVSCHTIEQTQALFTDNRFHNIGVGFKRISGRETQTAQQFLQARRQGADVDITVLTKADMSELGRFAVTENITEVGAFKTPTLRNIARTAPYMHDGSLATLEDVVDFYNNGGRVQQADPVSGFLSGGIRPLGLGKRDKRDLVEFMKALTSPDLDRFTKHRGE
ncbi:MAG TPA: cytochrome-c peroxidase [Gammaproteobacteria bacterium]|nr:cytochrome-c peroxidase [Gammaproteobacteria bacterium]